MKISIIYSLLAMFCLSTLFLISRGILQGTELTVLLIALAIVYVIIIAVMILWAMPLHYLAEKYQYRNVLVYLVIGVIPGPSILSLLDPFSSPGSHELFIQKLFFASVGLVGAWVFWFKQIKRA